MRARRAFSLWALSCAWSAACGEDLTLDLFVTERGDASFAVSEVGGPAGGACSTDRDCPAAKPHCDRSTCVECAAADGHCVGTGRPYCDPLTRSCIACRTMADCREGMTCNLGTHACAPQCGDGITCGGAPCADAGYCVECLGDEDCTGFKRYCLVSAGICVQCRGGDDCPETQHCWTERHTCRSLSSLGGRALS
jgi:hypothetical protein